MSENRPFFLTWLENQKTTPTKTELNILNCSVFGFSGNMVRKPRKGSVFGFSTTSLEVENLENLTTKMERKNMTT